MWTLEKVKDILACVQSAALALSIPVAGYWAYTRYGDLLEAERARTDIDRSRAEIEKARIEYEKTSKELSEREGVDVKVTARQISIPKTKTNLRHVFALIEIANIGNKIHTFWGAATLCQESCGTWEFLIPDL